LPAWEETLLAGKLARSSHEAIADGAAEFVTAEFVSAVRAGHGNFVKASNALYVSSDRYEAASRASTHSGSGLGEMNSAGIRSEREHS
jgi:hypothetical protein